LPARNSLRATLSRQAIAREKEIPKMFKIAAIIGGVLLLAGVALAGTVTSLGSTDTPSIASLPLASTTTDGQDDRGLEAEARGRENEPGDDLRGRENEPGEDLGGSCDEAEHANDPRCVGGAPATTVTTRDDDDRRGPNRGPGSGDDHGDRSGPGGGDDHGGGGHGGDDD
jgi:hypothetical protein